MYHRECVSRGKKGGEVCFSAKNLVTIGLFTLLFVYIGERAHMCTSVLKLQPVLHIQIILMRKSKLCVLNWV